MGQIRKLPSKLISFFIIGYRYCISPMLPCSCRFHPSCSQFALIAFETYGVCKGSWLTALRILRCNPWFAGGYDPVKQPKEKNN